MGFHCSYKNCYGDKEGVSFIRIPPPSLDLQKCEKWVSACGRKDLTPENVTEHAYICTEHFVGGQGPTKDHPDPIPFSEAWLDSMNPWDIRSEDLIKLMDELYIYHSPSGRKSPTPIFTKV